VRVFVCDAVFMVVIQRVITDDFNDERNSACASHIQLALVTLMHR